MGQQVKGCQQPLEVGKGKGQIDSPLETPDEVWPCQHQPSDANFRLLASRNNEKINFSCFKSPSLW